MNNFGESIISEFDQFYIWVTQIQPAYPKVANSSNINKVEFNWYWNGYNGIGEIYYFTATKTVCNVIGENFSNMTVNSNSKRKQPNGRSNCALYNDESLDELFTRILDIIKL